MKKLLALLLTLVMAISAVSIVPTVSAKSKVYKSNNCCYTLDKKGNATITGYCGPSDSDWNVKYWKIPSKLQGHTVKKLSISKEFAKSVYHFCKIKIPKSITYIKGLFSYIKKNGDKDYHTDDFNCLIICDEGSRAESYAKQCGLDYSIKGNVYGDVAFLGTYGFKYDFKKKDKSSKYVYMVFNGKERNLKFSIKRGKQVLKLNRDYSVKYLNNINPGLACAIIQGKGKFYGIAYIYYEIKPSKPKVVVTQEKYGVTAYYDNVLYEGAKEKFIVQYSETTKFKKYKTFTSYEYLTNLKKGKTYYFRCRFKTCGVTYDVKPYNSRNVKYSQITFASYYYPQYSPWSDVKAVKIKYDYSNKQ